LRDFLFGEKYMLIALIVLAVICLALAGTVIYLVRVVAAVKVSGNGYELGAALTPWKKPKADEGKKKKGML
jgi:hypothetical protein